MIKHHQNKIGEISLFDAVQGGLFKNDWKTIRFLLGRLGLFSGAIYVSVGDIYRFYPAFKVFLFLLTGAWYGLVLLMVTWDV